MNNAVNTSVAQVKAAPGKVERMTVAVVLNQKTAGSLSPAVASQLVSSASAWTPSAVTR